MSGTNGCSPTSSANHVKLLPFEKKTPGNPRSNDYGLNFDIDHDIVQPGATYQYNYGRMRETHGLGGGRSGYGLFGELVLDFSFKDGRTFHEVLDLRALMRAMLQKYEIYDLSKTKFGGTAEIIIKIDKTRITIDYSLTERKQEEPHFVLSYIQYPVFVKDFNRTEVKDSTREINGQNLVLFPGNPDQNLCGISFEVDTDSLASGTYRYSPEEDRVMQIVGGGRYGYQSAGELILNFTTKYGIHVHEKVDLRPLLNELKGNNAFIDIDSNNFGGYADFLIRITKNTFTINYRLLKRTEKTTIAPIGLTLLLKKDTDRCLVNYKLLQDLTYNKYQYIEYIYPIYKKSFVH